MSMNEIIPGLWIGDINSAKDTKELKENNIFSILSAMRGRITINETFMRHQILLDDTEEADIMTHFLPAITFIQAELDKGRSVLVHCQAGMSRSATIVAAYLMHSRQLTPEEALELIRTSRPQIDPNPGFLVQLDLFHKASFRISRRDKATRMFYMERAVEEVMNGDGSLPATDMFARFPGTPSSESAPTTPGGRGPRRRIRCKMCRQELAAREHMLDHGQLGDATPVSLTPAGSRHPSISQPQGRSRVGSSSTRPRRPSGLSSFVDSLSMSSAEPEDGSEHNETDAKPPVRRSSVGRSGGLRPFANLSRNLVDSLSMSALETEDAVETDEEEEEVSNVSIEAAAKLGRRMSDAVFSSPSNAEPGQPPSTEVETTQFSTPGDLAAQLYANPKLAALRAPAGISMTPLQTNVRPAGISPPIIVNPKCSGYFVEPMKWMEPFLAGGELAGKIVCPNKKCGAKLGNYDWAGVCCGCKAWVTPGFCINRSKVDEIVI